MSSVLCCIFFILFTLFVPQSLYSLQILTTKGHGLILTYEVTNEEITRFFKSRNDFISIINRIRKNENGKKH